jgi:hypothetical protein
LALAENSRSVSARALRINHHQRINARNDEKAK